MAKDIDSQALGQYIKARRLAQGLLLVDAAADSGLHYSYWSKLESGQVKTPSPKHLQSIARALEVDYKDLFVLAGYEVPEQLPTFQPYLRAKYQLPPGAIAELERYFDFLRNQYGIPKNEPVFPPKAKIPAEPETASPTQGAA